MSARNNRILHIDGRLGVVMTGLLSLSSHRTRQTAFAPVPGGR
jgi:hypothetical protein